MEGVSFLLTLIRLKITMFRFVVILLLIVLPVSGRGNNLSLRNGGVVANQIHIELAWDNAWNFTSSGGSHDAVWLFAKGRTSDGIWHPILLSPHTPEHTVYGEMEARAVHDSMGVFVFSSNQGGYSVPYSQVILTPSNNLAKYLQVAVYGIEMVYIPKGAFYLGDGASVSSLTNTSESPFLVSSEGAIASGLRIVNPNSEFAPTPLPSVIPKNYPKGFDSFFVMKYEVSQGQYVHFLNSLTHSQQKARTWIAPSLPVGTFAMVHPNQRDSLHRNGIVIVSSGLDGGKPAVYGMDSNANGSFNEPADGFHRAANFLSWADLSAYLCWAGLRPITEFEFEKACRGPLQPVPGEFAWGTAYVTDANAVTNDGLPTEGVSEALAGESGLANHGSIVAIQGWGLRGPLRTGFAATASSNRLQSGATYYGLMEMSGNVWEMVVMPADGGENFTRINGNGRLNEAGEAAIPNWCNPQTAKGVILRGGGWGSSIADVGSWRDLAVSDRFYSHLRPTQRRNTTGGRGGR